GSTAGASRIRSRGPGLDRFHPPVRCRLSPAMKRWPILRAGALFQEAILARYLGCRNSFLDPPPDRVPYLGKCVSFGTLRFERMARVPNHDQIMRDGQPRQILPEASQVTERIVVSLHE